MLTIRNWLIGYYIVEFEQNGKDRAEYGKSLLKSIAGKLSHVKGLDERSLRRFRLFYLYYPHLALSIRESLSPNYEVIKHGDIGQLNTYLNYFRAFYPLKKIRRIFPDDV